MNKSFFIGVALTALVAVGVIFWLLRKHKAETDGLSSLIGADKGQIAYHENKAREAIAQAVQARVSLDQYKESHPEEVAAILKEFGLKQAQLESYLKASFQVRDNGVSVVRTIYVPDTTTVAVDSTKEAVFEVADKFLKFKGRIITMPDFPWQEVAWKYNYSDTMTFVGRTDRKWFGGKQKYFVDGMVKNPKAQITSLRNVEITEFKDKRWSIGPAVLFDPFSGTVRFGVSAQYAIFKF